MEQLILTKRNPYISIDIQEIMQKTSFERSPTLDTVLMVERLIEKYSGEFNRTELWKKLPKKVMWQTYLYILDYLKVTNKIAFDKEGKVAYIWNPKLVKKILSQPNLRAK